MAVSLMTACSEVYRKLNPSLALSYNALHNGCIVDSFSRLSRLRYLNLKGNRFTEFPAAVREPSRLCISCD
jgi:hypothetical protein